MSESREKKRRYNLRLEYIQRFVLWLGDEPPIMMGYRKVSTLEQLWYIFRWWVRNLFHRKGE